MAKKTGREVGEAGRRMKKWVRQAGGEEQSRERERGWTASRSTFYKPWAKGGVIIRSNALSPEVCSPIGSRPCPARLLGSEAVSFAHSVRHGPEPCTKLPGCVMAIVRGLCRSHMPIQGIPGELRLVLLTCLACPCTMQPEQPGPCSTPLPGGELYRCRDARRHGMTFPVCRRCWWSRW